LRVVGAFWILFSIRPVIFFLRTLAASAFNIRPHLSILVNLLLLSGGIGLLVLREWGRWLLLIGLAALLVDAVGPSLLAMRVSPSLLRPILLYGIFIALLCLPQSRAATRK